jgi:hypothetical protein
LGSDLLGEISQLLLYLVGRQQAASQNEGYGGLVTANGLGYLLLADVVGSEEAPQGVGFEGHVDSPYIPYLLYYSPRIIKNKLIYFFSI